MFAAAGAAALPLLPWLLWPLPLQGPSVGGLAAQPRHEHSALRPSSVAASGSDGPSSSAACLWAGAPLPPAPPLPSAAAALCAGAS